MTDRLAFAKTHFRLGHLLLACLFVFTALPTESAAQIMVKRLHSSRIKKDLGGKGVVKVEPRSRGKSATHYLKSGQTMWEQTVWVTYRTEFKGVTKMVTGDVEYHWVGGRWKYNRFRKAGHSYHGLKNPSPKEFKQVLDIVGLEMALNPYTQKYATKVHSVKISKEPKWHWFSPTEVSFRATVTYDTKASSTELAKIAQDFDIYMKRGSFKGGFAAYCKKNPDCLGGSNPGQSKELSKTTVGADRLKKIPTVYQIAIEKWVTPKYAALGAPKEWTSLRQFANFTYKALYSGDEKTWQAFLIRNQDDWTHHDHGRDLFLKNKDAFRSQFCPQLVATKVFGRKGSDLTVKFSDKAGKSKCLIKVRKFNGYRVDGFSCEFAVGEEADIIAAVSEAKGCVEDLPPEVVYNKLGLKVGEKVMSKWHGTGKEYPGKVSQLKEKTIWIKYEDGMSEEIPYDGVRRKDGAAAPKAEPKAKADKATTPAKTDKIDSAADNPLGLKPGDPVMSKWHGNGKEYPGKVKEVKGGKINVHYDDGTKEWVPVKAVRRK